MNFIEVLFGIENYWAVLGILIVLQLLICAAVCLITKNTFWAILTLWGTTVFIVIYVWKFSWFFGIVSFFLSLGPAELLTISLIPSKDSGTSSSTSSGTRTNISQSTGTNTAFKPRLFIITAERISFLRGFTVSHPGFNEIWEFVAFFCVDTLAVEPSEVHLTSDFNDDLGADDLDFEDFVSYMIDSLSFYQSDLDAAKVWIDKYKKILLRNEEQGLTIFPVKTVKQLVDEIVSLSPSKIQYPKE
ncbi:MAG: hypothetical protein J6X71_00590 [Bacteroidales bacterium]|nr:hypothetical protein [Bacteroidales bacterium]